MELVLTVLGFLGFIAWRERQHAVELRAVAARRGGGKAPASVVSSRRRKRKAGRVRVISADDDAAFAEARGWETATEEPAPAEPQEDED